jgi:hypothetical protein
MSEFKFTCPVCSQHIAADSSAAGAQIECPTCFQKIIVPQAPRADSKYILSATQVIKPPDVSPPPMPVSQAAASRKGLPVAVVVLAVILCALLALVYLWRKNTGQSEVSQSPARLPGSSEHTRPGRGWSLNLASAPYPDNIPAGRIRNRNFNCERAIVHNGVLVLRQGSGIQPDLAMSIFLPVNGTPELDGKSFNIETNQAGDTPRVALRWKEAELQVSQSFTNGYALKLEFGHFASNRVSGKIYVCLPDVSKSFVAGSFDAEIRTSQSPRIR